MHMRRIASCCLLLFPLSVAGGEKSASAGVNKPPFLKILETQIEKELPSLTDLYEILHAHPELSLQEERTAARMAEQLKKVGFEVKTGIGGHGVVGVFRNGKGPTVLVRTDLDGLPVTEKTGLPYASKERTRDKEGRDVGIMHACGHDIHMTCWVGAARLLVRLKDRWQGTLVFIGQPAEEIGAGARAMLADGLFERFPRPDFCLALHCDSSSPVGHIAYSEGLLLANVDSVDIVVRGKGGHGSAPHTTIDPVVLAARIVLDLQTLVSREVNPLEAAVVTIGSIHGGTKHNIIPSEVKLQLTVRTLKDEVRKQVLDGIVRITRAAAQGARAPEPKIDLHLDDYTPAVFNDGPLARRVSSAFRHAFGKEKIHERGPVMGGEDFGRYGRAGVPIFFWFLGTVPQERWEASRKGGPPLPSLHSDLFAPQAAPTVRTGVASLALGVMELLGK